MSSINSLKKMIEYKKEDFINEHLYSPSNITMNINLYRKLVDSLTLEGMTIKEFEESIAMNIKTSKVNQIVLR